MSEGINTKIYLFVEKYVHRDSVITRLTLDKEILHYIDTIRDRKIQSLRMCGQNVTVINRRYEGRKKGQRRVYELLTLLMFANTLFT